MSRTLLLACGTPDNPDAAAAFFAGTSLDVTWVELEGGCHQTFALGLCGTLEPSLGSRLVNTYALAFARHHLLGDDAPGTTGTLDGTTTVDGAATVQRKP